MQLKINYIIRGNAPKSNWTPHLPAQVLKKLHHESVGIHVLIYSAIAFKIEIQSLKCWTQPVKNTVKIDWLWLSECRHNLTGFTRIMAPFTVVNFLCWITSSYHQNSSGYLWLLEELYALFMFYKYNMFHVYKFIKFETRACAIPRAPIWSTGPPPSRLW